MTRRKRPKFDPTNEPATSDPRQWVAFTAKACTEAMREQMESDGSDRADALAAGSEAWANCLPLLIDKSHVHCYIACIAHALPNGIINAEQARVMLYGAQMALAAMTKAGVR